VANKGDKAEPSEQVRPGENTEERADRNLNELLQELRVAIPGVQFLFAFLLTVPFAVGFVDLTDEQEDLYFAVLLATALTTVLLMAPTAYHRALFRLRDKSHLVEVSNKFAIAGMAMLAVSITGAVLFIAGVIFDGTKVVVFSVAVGACFALFWGVMPLMRRASIRRKD
jgi:cation transport ATPase